MHEFKRKLYSDKCETCGFPHLSPVHSDPPPIQETNLNPFDEKLREMITEKDAEIARLQIDRDNWKDRAIENNWPFEWQIAAELAKENKKLRQEIQKLNNEAWALLTYRQDAERYKKLKTRIEKSNGYHVIDLRSDQTLDSTLDSLPEVQS